MIQIDAKLLQQYVRLNDATAFEQLSRRYRDLVFATARRITGNHHDAEDVSQACFLELARQAGSRRISSVAGYLHTSATRRAINLIRNRSLRRVHEEKAASQRPEPVDAGSTERAWEEIAPEVDAAIEGLPDEFRIVVILFFLRGLNEAEIAAETGRNHRQVARCLKVGVRRLRATLSKPGGVVSLGAFAIGLRANMSQAAPPALQASLGRMALAGLAKPRVAPTGLVPRIRWLIAGVSFSPPLTWLAITCVLLLSAGGAFIWHNRASHDPYNQIRQAYQQFDLADETGFARHVAMMKRSSADFWRGSQPLFFNWCKQNCADWFADSSATVLCHASPHLNVGEHVEEIDADPAVNARLPIQIELLQGLISVRLAANRGFDSPLEDANGPQLTSILCQTYRATLLGQVSPPRNAPLNITPAGMAAELARYVTPEGKFVPLVSGRRGKIIEVLRPTSTLDAATAKHLINSAMGKNSRLGSEIKDEKEGVSSIAAANWEVLAVCQRIRLNTVTTQGETNYLVLVKRVKEQDVLIELNQVTPSPAELSGAVPADPRLPAQRAAENAQTLMGPDTNPIGWCEIGGVGFTVQIHEPSPSLTETESDRWQEPNSAARDWALAAAATHLHESQRDELAAKITPDLEAQLVSRSDAYIRIIQSDLQTFVADPRVAQDEAVEQQQLTRWVIQANSEIRDNQKELH